MENYWRNSRGYSEVSSELMCFGLLIPLYFLVSEETSIGLFLIYTSFLGGCYYFRTLVSAALLFAQTIFCIVNEGKIEEENQLQDKFSR